jgi:hypothetical protein
MRSTHGSSLAPSLQERGRQQARSAAINFSGFHLRTSHDSNELAFGVHHAHRGNRATHPQCCAGERSMYDILISRQEAVLMLGR